DNTLTAIAPHVGDIEIWSAVAIVIEPGSAHPRPDVFHTSFSRDIAEPALVVPVEVVAAKVVGDIQARPTASVVVAPRCGEAVAVIVHIDPARLGHVFESA